MIGHLHTGPELPAKKQTAHSCLDRLFRNTKYEHERGDGWLYPGEAITKAKTECEEQAFTLARTAP